MSIDEHSGQLGYGNRKFEYLLCRIVEGEWQYKLQGARGQLQDASDTYRAKSNGCRSEADESSISSMRLVDSIGIVIAKLLKNIVYALVVLGCNKFSYNSL